VVLRATPEPVRARHGKAPPLEARTRWDPWLPVNASGVVTGPLHALALAVLAIAVLFALAMAMMMVASL
jgi:hypothetical protein